MRLAVVVLIACLGVTPAFADARSHYRQGKAFLDAKAYDQAIAEFKQAYALDKLADHLFNIGLAYQGKGELKIAIEWFEKYLAAAPRGPKATEARSNIATATQQLAEAEKKQRELDEATRKAAADKKAKEDQDAAAKKLAVITHVKQAEAYAKAGAWAKAGEEHRAAAGVDDDPQHLLDAAAAFEKQPDLVKAREALLAYLAKVPLGANSDQVRVRVADLTRAIEKAETDERRRADEQRRKDELAKLAVVAPSSPTKSRRNSFGAELRGGIFSTGNFVTQTPSFMEIRNRPGPAFGVGVFLDFPLLSASHVHAGVRARNYKSSFEDCPPNFTCPSEVSATSFGPALTLEPSLYHHGRLDVYAVLGFAFMIGTTRSTFDGAPEKEIKKPQAEPELGLGGRFGPVSLNITFALSLTKISSLGLDLGASSGIVAAASWTLPR